MSRFPADAKFWAAAQALMSEDHNYIRYREHLAKAQSPKLPYLGVYLTDLTMLSDARKGNSEERESAMSRIAREFLDTVTAAQYKLELKVRVQR